jgi:prephenate dehydratase
VTQGVVPFENSTNGAVVFTFDLLADREKDYANTTVCGEAYLSVHHCLLGHYTSKSVNDLPVEDATDQSTTARIGKGSSASTKQNSSPGQDLTRIKHIYSHPQAFGQCELFLSKSLKGVERHDVSSTSKAAEIVAQDPTGSSAAIASSITSKVHRLQILAENIEDRDDNTTRFFILRRLESLATKIAQMPLTTETASGKHHKSLVSFTIDHHTPGALADALMVFKAHSLNLTSINSRPSRLQPWHYIFFIEFQGSRCVDPNGAVGAALIDLGRVADSWRWLGSWNDETIT